MYKVPSTQPTLSIFKRHQRRIRWSIIIVLLLTMIYTLGVWMSVALTMTDARHDAQALWGEYIFNQLRIIDLLIWLGLLLSPLLHRYVIKTPWFLKGITVVTLLFVSYMLISMPTYW